MSGANRSPAVIAAALVWAGTTQAQTPGEPLSWRPGARFTRHVDGSAPDIMTVRLDAGLFFHIQVIQEGSDLIVTFRDPQGTSIQVDSPNGRYGPETVAAITETTGEYQLQVKVGNPQNGANTYDVAVLALRQALPGDAEAAVSQRDYIEGYQLFGRHTPEASRQAVEKLERALNYFRKASDRSMTPLTLYTLGVVQAEAGEFRKVLALDREAVELFRAGGDSHGEARALNFRAGALDVLGDLPEALAAYRQALGLFASTGELETQALVYNNIGKTEANLGKWQAALEGYQQALSMARRTGNQFVEALALHNIGVAYNKLGEPERALAQYEQALPLWQMLKNKRQEASTLSEMASAYRALGQPGKGLPYLEQALMQWRSMGDRRGEAEALRNLGRVYTDLKRNEEARSSFARALELSRVSQDRSAMGIALGGLGRISLIEGEPAQAADWSAQALTEFRAIGDRNNEAGTLETAARAESARNNFAVALGYMEQALRLNETLRGGADSEELRTSFFATRQEAYRFYIDLLMRTGAEARALETNERSRARSLLEMLAEPATEIRQGVDPKLLERERNISDLLNAKGSRLLPITGTNSPRVSELTAEIRSLESEYQDVQAAIRRNSPRYTALTQPSVLNTEEIQRDVLDEDSLLLEYSLGAERSYLWVVGKKMLRAFELPARARIEEQVRRVSQLLAARADAPLATASRELSEMVLGKAAPLLGNKRLVIVPDGALQSLPFAMLPVLEGRTQEPLLVRHELVTLPSASALAAQRTQTSGRTPAPRMLAVFADPVFGLDDERVGPPIGKATAKASTTVRSASPGETSRILEHLAEGSGDKASSALRIPRLPYTAQEADQILNVAKNPRNLKAVGFQATRATAIGGQLSDYRYLHFATHGYLDTERPSLSALVLAQIDEKGQAEDGFLRVNDIYNARLSADLVVLSACQTGLGKEVRGEGLMGLTRAFLYAGVPRVIVSLWNVNDRATAELMASLYRKMLREGKTPAAALRAAQMELRKQKQWESPYYWAAFVQHGEWR